LIDSFLLIVLIDVVLVFFEGRFWCRFVYGLSVVTDSRNFRDRMVHIQAMPTFIRIS